MSTTPFWMTAFLDLAPDDADRAAAFWADVTGCTLSERRGEHDEFATLLPPTGDDHLCVQWLAEGEARLHLDLHVADPRAAADAAVDLGAAELADDGYVVLASPAGITFCFVTHPAAVRMPPATWPSGRSLVDQVCLDITPSAFELEHDFWQQVTGFESQPTDSAQFRRLTGPASMPLRLLLQRLDGEQASGAHLDLSADDREAEVERHLALGATQVRPDRWWTVLADPAGREYCITDRTPETEHQGAE